MSRIQSQRNTQQTAQNTRVATNSGNSTDAKRIMDRMADVASAYSKGKKPDGKCLMHVQNILENNNFPGAKVGRLPLARNFAETVDTNPSKYGLEKVKAPTNADGTVDLTKVPAGAIIVVAPGSPGTSHPTAGDIVIKGKGANDLFNGGEMGYAGRNSNFPAGKVLGIYVPTGANIGEIDFNKTTQTSGASSTGGGGTYTPSTGSSGGAGASTQASSYQSDSSGGGGASPSGTSSSGSPRVSQDTASNWASAQQVASSSSLDLAAFFASLQALLASSDVDVADADPDFIDFVKGLSKEDQKLPTSELKAKFLTKKFGELTAKKVKEGQSETAALASAKQELQRKYTAQPAVAAQRDVSMPING